LHHLAGTRTNQLDAANFTRLLQAIGLGSWELTAKKMQMKKLTAYSHCAG
jgi:hypothetical protein